MSSSVFVGEYLSGGGLGAAPGEADRALLAQGLAMRDALMADLQRCEGLALSLAIGPGVAAPAGVAKVAPRPGETMLDLVRREANAHDLAWIVAPETGGLLLACAEAVEPARWLGCRPDAIRLCSSKRATLERLAGHGLATPLACAAAARRWVVKPDDGAGGVDTRVHRERAAAEADLAARRARGAPAVLEPWVEGRALSLSLLCRPGETELLSVNRQHVEVGADGAVVYRGVDIDSLGRSLTEAGALSSTARTIGRAIRGLRGYVGVDLVWHADHGPVVIEVNPRPTCAYVGLSAALGRRLAAEVIAAHREAQRATA